MESVWSVDRALHVFLGRVRFVALGTLLDSTYLLKRQVEKIPWRLLEAI